MMAMQRLGTFVAVLATGVPAAAAPLAGGDEVEVQWGKKSYTLDELPEDWGPGVVATVEEWVPWAVAQGFSATLAADERVLFLGNERGGSVRKRLKVVESAAEEFDELLPVSNPGDEEEEGGLFGGGDFIPEDPEDEVGSSPFGATAPAEATSEKKVDVWDQGRDFVPDAFPAVLVVTADVDSYGLLLDRMVAREPELREWGIKCKAQTGFVCEGPVVGALQAEPEEVKDYEVDNEVANRVGRLLLRRRYGDLPYWLVQGFGWEVERATEREIAAFPFRAEPEDEDKNWEQALQVKFKERKDRALSLADFAHWPRDSYHGPYARISWALVAQLLADPVAFDAYCHDLRREWDKKNRSYTEGGRWRRLRTYQTQIELQGSLLEEHFGRETWQEVTDAILAKSVTKR